MQAPQRSLRAHAPFSSVLAGRRGTWPSPELKQRAVPDTTLRRCSSCYAKADKAQDHGPREKHKVFDSANIICRSGIGGNGEIVEAGKGKWVRNFKYQHNSGMKKEIWLPASAPADGQHGADVVIAVDPSVDTLLHLHGRGPFTAGRGANGNPAAGSGGPKRQQHQQAQRRAKPLKVPVPLGTVVKDGRGRVLAELTQLGDAVRVCAGGQGGRGVVRQAAKQGAQRPSRAERDLAAKGIESLEVEDANWKEDARGGPGEEKKLRLELRVVADAGFVGLPNAGKSSLLTRVTRATAEVADYPFTTLMPNLGVLRTGGDGVLGIGQHESVLVDLPGLIEGAHRGRGLGRVFLRHLARTRMLVHVVDAAAADPAPDYWAVREELRMYNPDYCRRPHVVALNKMDLPDARELRAELVHEIHAVAAQLAEAHPGVHVPPVAVHCCSAAEGEGVGDLVATIAAVLDDGGAAGDGGEDDVVDWGTGWCDEAGAGTWPAGGGGVDREPARAPSDAE